MVEKLKKKRNRRMWQQRREAILNILKNNLMAITCDASCDRGGVLVYVPMRGYVWVYGHAAAEVCCRQWPGRPSWSCLPPEDILKSECCTGLAPHLIWYSWERLALGLKSRKADPTTFQLYYSGKQAHTL